MKVNLSQILSSLESGGRPKGGASLDNKGIPSLGAEHLDGNGGFNFKSVKYIPEFFFIGLKYGIIEKENILIVKDGATTGKVSFVNEDFPFEKASVNEHVFLLKIDKSKAYPGFAFHYLKCPQGQRDIMRDYRGATVGGISRGFVEFVKFELPSIPAQLHIASILSKAESLISQRKESIRLLDKYLKSNFLEMFGSNYNSEKRWLIEPFGKYIETLTDYHANGSYESLREIVSLKKEPDYSLMVRTTDLENNNFTIDCNYIDERAYNFLEKSKVFGGEIIINKIGSAGKVYLMPFLNRPVSLGMNAFLLRFDNSMNIWFIYFLLTSSFGENEIQKNVKGAVTKTITKDAIRKIRIPVPPLSLQTQFAQIVEKTESLKAQYRQSLQELENLYGSLSQRAFRGEME